MIERDELATLLADDADLAAVQRAVVREGAIRKVMAQTGQGRAVVVEMIDAADAMGQEAVLELTEGNPTTLADALACYIRIMGQQDDNEPVMAGGLVSDLSAILEYPWRDEEALVQLHASGSVRLYMLENEDGDLEIRIGENRWLIYTAGSGIQGWAAVEARRVAEAVHRAVLMRVIADRDHHVQLGDAGRRELIKFLERPNGSWTGGGRLSVDAVSGGGVLVRTRPYTYQRPGPALAKDQAARQPCGSDGPRDLGYERPEGPGATDPADVPGQGRTDG